MPLTSSAAPLYDSIIWDKCVQSAYSFLKKSKLIMNEEKICSQFGNIYDQRSRKIEDRLMKQVDDQRVSAKFT